MSNPGARDGQTVEVWADGERKSLGTLEDRRYWGDDRRIHDQIFVRLLDYDPDWARQLPRPLGSEVRALKAIPVDLVLEDGQTLHQARLAHPWSQAVGQPLDDLAFQLEHPDL